MPALDLAREPRPNRAMARIGDFDLGERLAPRIPLWATQVGVVLLCTIGAGVVRRLCDLLVGEVAPFALVYPAVMLATLFGRARAGIVSAVVMIVYVWYYLYPIKNSFRFADTAGALAFVIVVVTAILVIALAELFRRLAYQATIERDREIADRDLFLAEVDHRMKNNFAIVAGLLDMQQRRAGDPATAEALGVARARVDSIARAHRHLYRGNGQPGAVEMRDYLPDLCAALSEALFLQDGITLACQVDDAAVDRDRAVSIGLVVNELVTNAAKHAFPGRELGTITVSFRAQGADWALSVADNGVGMPAVAAAPGPDHGLGTRLTEAFARQAGGRLVTRSDPTGTTVTLELAA